MSAYTGRIPWVGSPLGRNATLDHRSLWFLPPSGLPEGPTLSTGGNIPRIRRRAIAGERRVSARRVIRGVWLGRAAEASHVTFPQGETPAIFFFFLFGSVFFALYHFSRNGKIGLPPFTVYQDLKHPGCEARQFLQDVLDLTCLGKMVRPKLPPLPLIFLRDSRQAHSEPERL